MKNNVKKVEPITRKRMASSKDLKPKIHEEIGLRTHKTKGRKKKAQPAKIEG